jgi:hypothetical protein
MKVFLLKLFLVSLLGFSANKEAADHHPIFVSVTEIEHNGKEKLLEISCKIFTDDFEKALRTAYKTKVDLLNANTKPAMDKLVNNYLQKHLVIAVDGKACLLKFIGYEKIEEAIYAYFEVDNIVAPKKISITDDILYEYKKEQFSLLHVSVGGRRQSTKLGNPERQAVFAF